MLEKKHLYGVVIYYNISIMKEVECEYCDGKGRIEVEKDCFQPSWNCCGGCTEIVECPECEGSGEIEIEDEGA